MSTEDIVLLCMIDTMEGWEVANSDITGDFLQTNYNKVDTNIKLEGVMVTLLEDIEPDYYKYFIYTDKSGRKCMYAESKKAIYGNLQCRNVSCYAFMVRSSARLETVALVIHLYALV